MHGQACVFRADLTRVSPAGVKVTGSAQKLGQLEAIHRDLQSKSRANLQLLGQPGNFRAARRRDEVQGPDDVREGLHEAVQAIRPDRRPA